MWAVISILALVFALASACLSAVVYISSSKKLERQDISKLLEKSCEELSANYAKQLRGIETEWEDMYQKFTRLTGRVEKSKGLATSEKESGPITNTTMPMRRSDLVRKFREVHHE